MRKNSFSYRASGKRFSMPFLSTKMCNFIENIKGKANIRFVKRTKDGKSKVYIHSFKIEANNGFINKIEAVFFTEGKDESDFSDCTMYFEEGKLHKFDGPACTFRNFEDYGSRDAKVNMMGWIIYGQLIFDNHDPGKHWKERVPEAKFPIYMGDEIINGYELNKVNIMNAMMVNREYGRFLLKRLNGQTNK